MGFLDFIFRKDKGRGAETETPINAGLGDIEGIVGRGLEKKLSDFYPEAASILKGIRLDVGEMRRISSELSGRPMKSAMPQYEKIERQMKENFFLRMPKILAEMVPPEKTDFALVREFHSKLVGSLAALTKITSDNRYLVAFQKGYFEELGVPVKALAKKADLLGDAISRNSGAFEKVEEIRRLQDELAKDERAIFSLREEMGRIDGKLRQDAKDADASIILKAREDYRRAEAGLAGTQADVSRCRGEVASIILPLERLIRKYEKAATDRENAKMARECLLDLNSSLEDEGKIGELERISKDMAKMLADGTLFEEERDRKKHMELLNRIIAGEAAVKMAEMRRLRGLEAEGKKAVQLAGNSLSEIEGKEKEAKALVARKEKLVSELAGAVERRKNKVRGLEVMIGEFTGKKIVLIVPDGT